MLAETVRNLVWVERDHDALAFLWHAVAPQARVLRLGGLAPDQCGLDWSYPAGAAIRPLLPPEALLADDAAALAQALRTTLGGARGLRAMAVGAAARPAHVAAVLAQLSPNLLCRPQHMKLAMPADAVVAHPVVPLRDIGLDDIVVWADAAAAAWLDRALLRLIADWQARTNAGGGTVNVADLLALQGLFAVEGERATAHAWTGPQLRTVLLVPDFGGRAARLTLHLAASRLPLDTAHFGVWIDGAECPAIFDPAASSIEVVAHGLIPQPFRRLDLRHAMLRRGPQGERPAGCALHAVTMERVA